MPQTTVDVKTVCTLNKRFDIYLDAYNVNNAPNRLFEWEYGRPQNTREDSLMFLFGVNGRL